jgi:hypothetical protein
MVATETAFQASFMKFCWSIFTRTQPTAEFLDPEALGELAVAFGHRNYCWTKQERKVDEKQLLSGFSDFRVPTRIEGRAAKTEIKFRIRRSSTRQ